MLARLSLYQRLCKTFFILPLAAPVLHQLLSSAAVVDAGRALLCLRYLTGFITVYSAKEAGVLSPRHPLQMKSLPIISVPVSVAKEESSGSWTFPEVVEPPGRLCIANSAWFSIWHSLSYNKAIIDQSPICFFFEFVIPLNAA